MSLTKAIQHGKEFRNPYRGSKRFDKGCRNHGDCGICGGNRKHKFRDPEEDWKKEISYNEEMSPKTRQNAIKPAIEWATKHAPMLCADTAIKAFEDGYNSGFLAFVDFVNREDPGLRQYVDLDKLAKRFLENLSK